MPVTPYQWLTAVRDAALEICEASTTVEKPDTVEIGDMQTAGLPKNLCGALFIDGGVMYETGDRFPDRLQQSQSVAAFRGCPPGVALPITLRYLHCVPAPNSGPTGTRPPTEWRDEYSAMLWNFAWEMWEGIGCNIKPWKRRYGPIVRGQLTPLPRNASHSGFTITLTASLRSCEECS